MSVGIELALMRGGTSRGAVLRLDDAPPAGPDRDALARRLIGHGPVDGLGGGSAETSKVVLVGPGDHDVDLQYVVGNLSPYGTQVDWSGTCGNMTAAVVPFAALAGLADDSAREFRLRNLATGAAVEVTVCNPAALATPGAEIELTTTFLDPGGAVLGATLPTGLPRDELDVDGESVAATIIDVTHPYVFVGWRDAVRSEEISSPAASERIERIRGAACVRLGLCSDPDDASRSSPTLPRIVLIHGTGDGGATVEITAISMGQVVAGVPVTAAMSLAAARLLPGTLVTAAKDEEAPGDLVVYGPAAALRARATLDASGLVESVSVRRTSRCLIRGRVGG